jgi:fructose-1-phosphate kinase PfkB-like protein
MGTNKHMNGLNLNSNQFEALPNKEKLTCLFENQVKTLDRFNDIEKIIKGYRFHQKVQYVIMSLLAAGGAFLIKLHIGQ